MLRWLYTRKSETLNPPLQEFKIQKKIQMMLLNFKFSISGTEGMDGEFYDEQAVTLNIYTSYESYVHQNILNPKPSIARV